MLLSESPLGDAVPILNVVWTVDDVERLQEAFLSDPRIAPIPFDPASFVDEDSPPPKAVYMIFDRPAVESVEGVSAQSMPNYLGQLFIFGRQTDREARLELVGVTAAELPQIKTILNELAGQWLQGQEKIEEIGIRLRHGGFIAAEMAAAGAIKTPAVPCHSGRVSARCHFEPLDRHETRLSRRSDASPGRRRRQVSNQTFGRDHGPAIPCRQPPLVLRSERIAHAFGPADPGTHRRPARQNKPIAPDQIGASQRGKTPR